MQSVSDVLGLWPSYADLGRDMGVPYPTVVAWKQRASIPVMYWRELIRAARRRGHPEVTADLLVDLHARALAGPGGLAEDETPFGGPDPESPSAGSGGSKPAGHFSRFKHLRRAHFASAAEINAHIRALREEWDRR